MSKPEMALAMLLALVLGLDLAHGSPDPVATESKEAATPRKRLELRIDVKKEKKLQEAVDQGHQPWRLDAVTVAAVAIGAPGDVHEEKCTEVSRRPDEAVVRCVGAPTKMVVLRKLVRIAPDGIWTAVEIDE